MESSVVVTVRMPLDVKAWLAGPVAPVFLEVGLGAVPKEDLPSHLKGAPGLLEARGRAAGAFSGVAPGIEAAGPLPVWTAGRIADALGDGADPQVAAVDQPSLLAGIRIAAAGEGGHATMIAPI
jgi:hypothetical protein